MNELVQFDQNFDFKKKGIIEKNSYERPRLWVGRRQEPILGYIWKFDGKIHSVHKGLTAKEKTSDEQTPYQNMADMKAVILRV